MSIGKTGFIIALLMVGCKKRHETTIPGHYNTVIGDHAGMNLRNGDFNIILGDYAGADIVDESYWLVIDSFRYKMTELEAVRLRAALLLIIDNHEQFYRPINKKG